MKNLLTLCSSGSKLITERLERCSSNMAKFSRSKMEVLLLQGPPQLQQNILQAPTYHLITAMPEIPCLPELNGSKVYFLSEESA